MTLPKEEQQAEKCTCQYRQDGSPLGLCLRCFKMEIRAVAQRDRELWEKLEGMELPKACPKNPNGFCNQRDCSWCGSFLRKSEDAQSGYNQAISDIQQLLNQKDL